MHYVQYPVYNDSFQHKVNIHHLEAIALLLLAALIAISLTNCYGHKSGLYVEKAFGYNSYTTTSFQQTQARVHVGQIPQGIDVNPNTNLIYVANGGSDYISVINGSLNKVIANITSSSKEPFQDLRQVAVNPITNIVYAVGEGDKAVYVINGSTNREVYRIPLEEYPHDVAVNPNTNKIYVTFDKTTFNKAFNKGSITKSTGFVAVIDGTDNNVTNNIQVGTSPSAIAVNPNTNMVYVADNDYSIDAYHTSRIYVLNPLTKKIVANLPVALNPYDLAVNIKTNMIYVINEDDNRVSVINGYSNKLANNIITKGSYSPTGILVSSIAVNPNTNTIYTVNTGSDYINVLNASTNKITLSNIASTGSLLSSIAVNPSNNVIYVTDQGANIVYALTNATSTISRNNSNLNIQTPFISSIGINLDEKPKRIAVDSRSNRLYVIYENSKEITTIDGSTNRKLMPFKLNTNTSLTDIAANPNTHMIYAISEKSLNIIDAHTNSIKILQLNDSANAIDVNPDTNTIYVLARSGGLIYVVDGVTNQIVDNIQAESSIFSGPESLSIDPNTEKLYTIKSHGLSVIDKLDRPVANFTVNTDPFARIAVNPNTNTIYVANENDRSVYVVDSYTGSILKTVEVDGYPKSITVNPTTNFVYVANDHTGIVSVIDGTDNNVTNNIQVGTSPSAIAVNPNTNMVYVANQDSDTISIINGTTNNKIAVGVVFDMLPTNSGHIRCENEEVATNMYIFIDYGNGCKAEANNGFQFSSWSENLGHNSTKTIQISNIPTSPFSSLLNTMGFKSNDNSTLEVLKYGNYTANFKAIPPPIPPEYWIPLYGVIVSSIVGWSIPSIVGWIKAKKQQRRVKSRHLCIKSLYDDNRLDEKDIADLNGLNTDIMGDYVKGKISEQHYDNLKNEISILYEQIYNNKIDSLNTDHDNGIALDKVKDDIKDAYAKGKISEQHYKLLNEKISDSKNNRQYNNNQLASSSENSLSTATTKGSPIKRY
jgi:YVTN family beta-propeller protein